jgi:hypothetical protein
MQETNLQILVNNRSCSLTQIPIVWNQTCSTKAAKTENALKEFWPLRIERREWFLVFGLEHCQEVTSWIAHKVGS